MRWGRGGRASVSRRAVEPGSWCGVATAGRAGEVLHDQLSASRRTTAAWWRGTGLLVLDADEADAAPDVLDGAGRQHADNGCLYYVPGSHKWDLLPVTGLAGDMDEIMTVLDDEQKEASGRCRSS